MKFLKRVILSITEFDAYKTFAIEKNSIAIKYILKLLLLFSIILSSFIFVKYAWIFNGNEESLRTEFSSLNLEESILSFENQEAIIEQTISYITSMDKTEMYAFSILTFIITFSILFIMFFTVTGMYVVMLAIFIHLFSKVVKAPIIKTGIVNIAIYAHTLPIILMLIYQIIRISFNFNIEYFDIMYTAISMIYAITAILLIKSDILKSKVILDQIIKETEEKIEELRKEENNEDKKEDEEEEKEEVPKTPPVEEGGKA